MKAHLKYLVLSTALVGTMLTGTSSTVAASASAATAGSGAAVVRASAMAGAAGFVHATGGCKKDQIDACKPGGCCIVD